MEGVEEEEEVEGELIESPFSFAASSVTLDHRLASAFEAHSTLTATRNTCATTSWANDQHSLAVIASALIAASVLSRVDSAI